MENRWYVIYTKSRQEKYVAKWLIEKGISYYLPLHKKVRQWKDRRKWVEVPLINSYIFVRVRDDREYIEILQTDGVVSFITFEGKPATVPEQQIDAIKLLLAGEADLDVTSGNFEKGDEIEVKAGPLKGLQGELINVKNKRKVIVRIEHIRQALLVDIDMKYLEKKNRHS
ncbi:MAG: UpxY family transcription antiterminator [Bacteroidales bacterium]|nr:UpxY family transcription antiterminator [Bacteroidales bacterium]